MFNVIDTIIKIIIDINVFILNYIHLGLNNEFFINIYISYNEYK